MRSCRCCFCCWRRSPVLPVPCVGVMRPAPNIVTREAVVKGDRRPIAARRGALVRGPAPGLRARRELVKFSARVDRPSRYARKLSENMGALRSLWGAGKRRRVLQCRLAQVVVSLTLGIVGGVIALAHRAGRGPRRGPQEAVRLRAEELARPPRAASTRSCGTRSSASPRRRASSRVHPRHRRRMIRCRSPYAGSSIPTARVRR